jgi:hypothetical protein
MSKNTEIFTIIAAKKLSNLSGNVTILNAKPFILPKFKEKVYYVRCNGEPLAQVYFTVAKEGTLKFSPLKLVIP